MAMESNRALSAEEQLAYEQIAAMLTYGVPQKSIAEAMGLSEGRISQIVADPRFAEYKSNALAESLAKSKSLDDGWDAIEQMALGVVAENLKYNKDPEFALKAASLSNRASRRGQNATINAPAAGERVVLNLNQTFLGQLQELNACNTTVIEQKIDGMREKKQSDMLSPKALEALLKPPEKQKMSEMLDQAFPLGLKG